MDRLENVWIKVYGRVYDKVYEQVWDLAYRLAWIREEDGVYYERWHRSQTQVWDQVKEPMMDILLLSLDLKQEVLSLKKHG